MVDPIRLNTLLAATAREDEKAFEQLYELTSANLYGVAMRILKKQAPAEDALQDAFVQIWHRAGEFHAGKGSPMAWMSTIVRYRALDIIRKDKRTVSLGDTDIEQVDLEMGPLSQTLQSDNAKALLACLDELEAGQRNSIMLSFYEGLTHDELAARIARPLGTVKSWIRRGLQKVRECLER